MGALDYVYVILATCDGYETVKVWRHPSEKLNI